MLLTRAARLAARAYERDRKAVRAAFDAEGLVLHERSAKRHYVLRYFGGNQAEDLVDPLSDPIFGELWGELRRTRTTLLYYDRLYVLYQALQHVIAVHPAPVEVLEVGVYRGGSTWFLASAGERMAPGSVHITAVDTFEGHSELDLGPEGEGPHKPGKFGKGTSVSAVRDYLSHLHVEVIQGRIQDVAAKVTADPIALVHIDVDIYEPMAFTLGLVAGRMATGGIIVADDYGSVTCPGARQSVDEFCEAQAGRFFKLELQTGQALLLCTRPPS